MFYSILLYYLIICKQLIMTNNIKGKELNRRKYEKENNLIYLHNFNC